MDILYAEDIGHYWKTGKSSPDRWIDLAIIQIEDIGGYIISQAFGQDGTGKAVYMLAFDIDSEQYKIIWPVLPSKTNNQSASRIQAATMLYHDVKAKCMSAAVLGTRTAFFSFLVLPDGRTAASVANPELIRTLPLLLRE